MKKLAVLLLVVVIAVLFYACGGRTSEGTDPVTINLLDETTDDGDSVEKAVLPDVIGMDKYEAKAQLEELGFKVKMKLAENPDGETEGTVRDCDGCEPGEEYELPKTITLYCYDEPASSEEAAQSELEEKAEFVHSYFRENGILLYKNVSEYALKMSHPAFVVTETTGYYTVSDDYVIKEEEYYNWIWLKLTGVGSESFDQPRYYRLEIAKTYEAISLADNYRRNGFYIAKGKTTYDEVPSYNTSTGSFDEDATRTPTEVYFDGNGTLWLRFEASRGLGFGIFTTTTIDVWYPVYIGD